MPALTHGRVMNKFGPYTKNNNRSKKILPKKDNIKKSLTVGTVGTSLAVKRVLKKRSKYTKIQ